MGCAAGKAKVSGEERDEISGDKGDDDNCIKVEDGEKTPSREPVPADDVNNQTGKLL